MVYVSSLVGRCEVGYFVSYLMRLGYFSSFSMLPGGCLINSVETAAAGCGVPCGGCAALVAALWWGLFGWGYAGIGGVPIAPRVGRYRRRAGWRRRASGAGCFVGLLS